MGMLGELFPGPKINDEAGEDGDGQKWRLGPIDLDSGVVTVHRSEVAQPDSPSDTQPNSAAPDPAPDPEP